MCSFSTHLTTVILIAIQSVRLVYQTSANLDIAALCVCRQFVINGAAAP